MGVSKHYHGFSRHGGGGNRIDYALAVWMADAIPAYANNRVEREHLEQRVRTIKAQFPKSWRKRLRALLALRTRGFREDYTIQEFQVYPGRSRESCGFRRVAQSVRRFQKKKPVSTQADWAALNLAEAVPPAPATPQQALPEVAQQALRPAARRFFPNRVVI